VPVQTYQGAGYSIEPRWKEVVIYWEGDRGVWFYAAWGVEPPTLYVPTDEVWRTVMPEWIRGKRAEVVARLGAHSGHDLQDDPKRRTGDGPSVRSVEREQESG
jgi:hypothetical protein